MKPEEIKRTRKKYGKRRVYAEHVRIYLKRKEKHCTWCNKKIPERRFTWCGRETCVENFCRAFNPYHDISCNCMKGGKYQIVITKEETERLLKLSLPRNVRKQLQLLKKRWR